MLAPSTTDDEGHNSSHNLYDGRDDTDDIYDNEPLILPRPSGNFSVFHFTLHLNLKNIHPKLQTTMANFPGLVRFLA